MAGTLWTSMMANFGGKPMLSKIGHVNSYKSTIFLSLLAGLVVWISYRAFITSELSVIVAKYPFNDLESLSKTNYL